MFSHQMVPATWILDCMPCLSSTCEKRYSNMGWGKLPCRLWTLKIFNKLYNTWVPLMGPSKQQVHVKCIGGGVWASRWCKIRLQSIKNETGQLVSHPWPVDRRPKFKIASGSASCSVKFKFGAKIGHIWAMPAQIWEVHMSNVRMSNADEGPAGGGIKAAGA